jgi:hypothetical protein
VVREKSAAQYNPFRKSREKAGCKGEEGEKSSDGRSSDTKLRIIRRLNLFVS